MLFSVWLGTGGQRWSQRKGATGPEQAKQGFCPRAGEQSLHDLIASFIMVFLGEMGDKSQLLAMAFASRFPAWQVMPGVFLATLLNQGLAVMAGTYLAAVVPMTLVSIAAGISFLVFGLWTLRGDSEGEEAQRVSRLGPVMTVALTFFLGEMGDKTQLATVALAAEFHNPTLVLTGTVAGMVAANGLGVLVGDFVGRRLSPRLMRLLAGGVFLLFGFITLFREMGA